MDGFQEVTVKPWADTDPHGDDEYGTPYTLKGVIVWSRTSDELERGGIPVEGWNVYIQPGKRIPMSRDRITYDGLEYSVEGRPLEYPLGGVMHTLVVLKGAN